MLSKVNTCNKDFLWALDMKKEIGESRVTFYNAHSVSQEMDLFFSCISKSMLGRDRNVSLFLFILTMISFDAFL